MSKRALIAGAVLATGSLTATGAMAAPAGAAPAQDAGRAPLVRAADAVSGQYIVVLDKGVTKSALRDTRRDVRQDGGAVIDTYSHLGAFAATLSATELSQVRHDPDVAFVQENGVVTTQATQSGATWGLDRIDQATPTQRQLSVRRDGTGVTAYIIDTGIRRAQEFGGRVGTGYDAIGDGDGIDDCDGHGTHVAGTVGGTTYGVAKDIDLVPVRVLDCNGNGSDSGVIAGIDWVTRPRQSPAWPT